MSLGGGPALRLLLRLKLRGTLRKQARRLKTLKGLLLGLVGCGLFVLWIGSLLLQWILDPRPPVESVGSVALVRLAGLGLTALSLASALTHRGLYVPGEEIERLFAAPVRRGDIVRYRLIVNVARAMLGGLILGLLMMRHMPHPLFAFCGTLLAMQTLPVIGQMAAIMTGALERRAFNRLKLLRGLALPLAILVGAGVIGLAFSGGNDVGRFFRDVVGDVGLLDVANHPVMRAVTLPFAPWANAVSATGWGEFGLWFGISLAAWFALYELAARIPIDFRELSLQTSSDVADRIRRMQRAGGGASAGKVSRGTLSIGVPWLLGRGPAGAVAWRKVGSILRKARGTLMMSSLILIFVVLLSRLIFEHGADDEEAVAGQVLVAFLGLLYLAGGLRFDFRDELDRMESIKAWPLSSRRVFFAMLFPEVLVIAALIGGAVIISALLAGGLAPFTLALVLALPLVAFAWVALDNAVYLFAPVRVIPGQEGVLQNAGRSMLLLLLRFVLLAVVVALTGAGGSLAWFVVERVTGEEGPTFVAAYLVGGVALLAVDVGLNELGAWAFRRFDVARDRG